SSYKADSDPVNNESDCQASVTEGSAAGVFSISDWLVGVPQAAAANRPIRGRGNDFIFRVLMVSEELEFLSEAGHRYIHRFAVFCYRTARDAVAFFLEYLG